MSDTPIYITTRDRVSDLRLLVEWLERAGHTRIHLLDCASTWPPLLEYLNATPHRVVRLEGNLGSRALWEGELVPDEPFVLTDPDVVPIAACPLDAIEHLSELLQRYPQFPKAGLGLYLDDVPEDLRSLAHERQLVAPDRQLAPGVYDSLIDTTFALYRPNTPFCYEGIRTGAPYQARHLPWYRTGELSEEDRYYLDHATAGPLGSSWKETLEKEKDAKTLS